MCEHEVCMLYVSMHVYVSIHVLHDIKFFYVLRHNVFLCDDIS